MTELERVKLALRDAIEAAGTLQSQLAEAREAELNALSTLDAWFDRRKLGHEAIDDAVIGCVRGYLRVSNIGGMSSEEADSVEAVIEDMCRLGTFADLFARAALKDQSHG
tara:strand:+ start:2810 stop:3139 length:330 start_codon:yes stop_codon:yes gene_type:complete